MDNQQKAEKILSIVKREFQRELVETEREAAKVEDAINETKKLMNKLRITLVNNYYKSSSEVYQEVQRNVQQNSLVPSGVEGFEQKAIHPSLKKLIGKRPIESLDELTQERAKRKSAQRPVAPLNDTKVKIRKADEPPSVQAQEQSTSIDVKVAQMNSSRGKDQIKHTIVVGNTSQYIKEPLSVMTHKWLCYVKTRSPIPADNLIKKVRFHLDSSYKPNDVVEIDSPPFQLVRRGYGEFIIKLEIVFKNEAQAKPVQIYHQLVLDKKCSRHQTLGNETITEFWTRNFNTGFEVNRIESSMLGSHLADHDYFKLIEPELNEVLNEKTKREEVVDWIILNYTKVIKSSSAETAVDLEVSL